MKRFAVVAVFVGSALFATPSFALEGCTCAGTALNGAKVLGTVDAASGAVTLDGAKAQAGMVLKNGSTIATGKEGSASVSVSGCSVPMTAASSVSVSQTGPDVCVKLVENGKLVTARQFAGVLPGEQQGASSQRSAVTDEQAALGQRMWNIPIGGIITVATALGVVTYSVTQDGVECVSNCG